MKIKSVMMKSFFVNISLVFLKVIFGLLFGSLALIADGVHSISDLFSDIFVLLGINYSQKPADEEHPFGHGKFEYVLSLLLGFSVLFIAYNLGREIIVHFNRVTDIPNYLSLVVVVLVVLAKFILSRYLISKGEELDSEIVSASGKESLTDVFSSGVVFIGISFVLIGEQVNSNFLLHGDKIASIIIVVFILKVAFEIIKDSITSLQGKAVKKEIRKKYELLIKDVKGVIGVDHIDMIAYGPYYQTLVDIRVDGTISVKEGHDIAREVSKTLYEDEKINHVVVHVNPEE